MYSHEVEAQVTALKEAGIISGSQITKTRKTLEAHWEKKIAVVWMVEDVLWRADDIHKKVTEEEAIDVLQSLLNNHDAGLGICWDTFDYYLEDYPDMTEKEIEAMEKRREEE